MDATTMALRQPLYCSSCIHSSSSKGSRILRGSVCMKRRMPVTEILSSGFRDQSHLHYYNPKFRCCLTAGRRIVLSGKQEKAAKEKSLKKMKKKQLKLLKGLTRDLSSLSQIGFGLNSDGALLDQVKGNMISEAAEVLIEQLHKIRSEEKEQKRKMKEEKASLKAVGRMQNSVNAMTSSSSSDSSDSECGEVIDMNQFKLENSTQIGLQPIREEKPKIIVPTVTSLLPVVPVIEEEMINSQHSPLSNVDSKMDNPCPTGPGILALPTCTKKIEVCMGGKCKKLGGGTLLEEFEKAVGLEGVVVSGCKCMGKCRDGPNVKVLNGGVVADDTARAPANSVCLGVGLEDVTMIVANLFGENRKQLSFAAAS